MRVWLVQRAESTPHDDGGERRLLRVGILADILQSQGHEVVWWQGVCLWMETQI